MAQGRQSRLSGHLNIPKQCLSLNGKRIIQRTLDQLKDNWPQTEASTFYIVCNSNNVWTDTLGQYSVVPIELTDPGLCILMGIEACLKRFVHKRNLYDRFVFVLADTVFANDDAEVLWKASTGYYPQMTDIFFLSEYRETDHDLHIKTLRDIFAFGFKTSEVLTILGALNDLNCRHTDSETVMSGHLRKLKAYFRRYRIPFDALVTSGYTRDIDTPEDLTRLPELEALVKEDDNG